MLLQGLLIGVSSPCKFYLDPTEPILFVRDLDKESPKR